MRIVCAQCAARLDWSRGVYRTPAARAKWFAMVLLLATGLIAILLILINQVAF